MRGIATRAVAEATGNMPKMAEAPAPMPEKTEEAGKTARPMPNIRMMKRITALN
jgi:hypothetical protein